MSRKKKIFLIVHFCLALSYLCWLFVQPYAKNVLLKKSELSLYQMVMEREKLFEQLSPEDQATLIQGYATALQKKPHAWTEEIKQVLLDTPPFALAWLFFSLVICLLLFFQIEGAVFSVWLLPCIVLIYAYFLYETPKIHKESLFPAEEYVLTTYMKTVENKAMGERERLLLAWHRYLVVEWAHEPLSEDSKVFQEQLDKGLFAFNVARLKWILQGKGDEVILSGFTTPPSLLGVSCYFIWNLCFAWIINRKEKSLSTAAPSAPTC